MEIRRLSLEDLTLRVKWMNDKRIYSYMHYKTPITLNDTINWFNNISQSFNRVDFAITDNNNVISMGGLTNIDEAVKKAELYIFVDPELKGKGIGSNSVNLICHYGFNQVRLNKIYLLVDEQNITARKIYEKNNFKMEGLLRNDGLQNGIIVNRCYYGILEKEFNIH